MDSKEIRKIFLKYFEQLGHKIVPSDSLIPSTGDPTLLFTSAGMVQFKDYFLGKKTDMKRAASCQKCFRTSDLEKVGHTRRHLTFFEMLGNFSFGDYFKKEAIQYAWEFLTKELSLPKEKLYVTIYKEDTEAAEIWKKIVPEDRIVPLGEDSNFWSMGPTGPCGPCSEIIYDIGEKYSCGRSDCFVGCSCERWLEVWNLVFTQFDRQEDGKMLPLPRKNIDTGMGLERLSAVVNETYDVFLTDLLYPIIEKIRIIFKDILKDEGVTEARLRIIADHVRAICFLLSDGVVFSNEGRGYVLRRLLRHALCQGELLYPNIGIFLHKLVDPVCEIYEGVYGELLAKGGEIKKLVKMEEEKFIDTLRGGLEILSSLVEKYKGKKVIPGEDVFKLYDTYGFPPELTQEIASSHGFNIEMEKFNELLLESQERARRSWHLEEKEKKFYIAKDVKSIFDGYDVEDKIVESVVLRIIKNEAEAEEAVEGELVSIILDRTTFYGESGGQVGDTGIIENDICRILISDTQKHDNAIIHIGKVAKGKVRVGDVVIPKVDIERRKSIQRNHTATHILHRVLRNVIGEHALQSGSLVAPDRLRFDFVSYKALSDETIRVIEENVNKEILENYKVLTFETQFSEAKRMNATALFTEKYEDIVRVVMITKYDKEQYEKAFSIELCGGTHCKYTGEIGMFKILKETSVSANIRRIEAVTGYQAYSYVRNLESKITELSILLKATPENFIPKINKLFERQKELEKEVEVLQQRIMKKAEEEQQATTQQAQVGSYSIGNTQFVIYKYENISQKVINDKIDLLKQKDKNIYIIINIVNNKPTITVGTSLGDEKINALSVAKCLAPYVNGAGGGRKDLAWCGGKNIDGVEYIIGNFEKIIKEKFGL
jgi:alanyl-tRNA synthetase